MNLLEARSHSIQTKQRAKSREGERQGVAHEKTSPGAGLAKEKEMGGSARNEARETRVSDKVETAEAEEAVKKIYLITGACCILLFEHNHNHKPSTIVCRVVHSFASSQRRRAYPTR